MHFLPMNPMLGVFYFGVLVSQHSTTFVSSPPLLPYLFPGDSSRRGQRAIHRQVRKVFSAEGPEPGLQAEVLWDSEYSTSPGSSAPTKAGEEGHVTTVVCKKSPRSKRKHNGLSLPTKRLGWVKSREESWRKRMNNTHFVETKAVVFLGETLTITPPEI